MTFLIAPCPRCPFMLETIVARNYTCDLIKPNFPLNLIVLSDFLFLLLETLNSEENETKEVMFSSFNFFKINFVAISSFAILYTRLHDYSGNLPEYLLKVKSWNTSGVRQTKSQHTQSMIKIRGMAVQKLSSVTLKRKTKACFGDLRTILKTLLLTTAILLLIIINNITNNVTIIIILTIILTTLPLTRFKSRSFGGSAPALHTLAPHKIALGKSSSSSTLLSLVSSLLLSLSSPLSSSLSSPLSLVKMWQNYSRICAIAMFFKPKDSFILRIGK